MKKKLALSIISMNDCFPQGGFKGGGHKVTKKLIECLIESGKFDIDVFCKKSNIKHFDGINSITVLNKKTFNKDLKTILKQNDYDYVLASDVMIPFANNLIHSNSSAYKSKNCKNSFQQFILKIFNAKKIKRQEKNMSYDKSVFTVSESLRKDYVENFHLNPDNVYTCIPAVDDYIDFIPPERHDVFTIGSIVGGGINKGGYLLLRALKKIPDKYQIKAKVIFPKYNKSGIFRKAVKLLGLENKIEVLPRQSDMSEYYKSIDCYVLPSLNEAFGLVVTEAASNSKPSIVSSTTGVRELIKDDTNGFVFDRTKHPAENLAQKIQEVSELYFNNFDTFQEVAQNAHKIPQKLNWKTFTNTIIENMTSEK